MITSEAASEATSLIQQGVAAAKAGDKEGAKPLLRRAAELDPSSEAAWLWLASLYTELPIVAHCLQMALQANPANAQAAQALQTVMAQLQNGEQATHQGNGSGPLNGAGADHEGDAEQQYSSEYDFEELKRRGIVAGKGGRREEAKQYLLAATDANDSDPEVWLWLSTVVDDPEDKQIALENVLALDPLNMPARTAIEANAEPLERVRRGEVITPPPAPDPSKSIYQTTGPFASGPLLNSGPSSSPPSGPLFSSGPLNSGALNSGALNSGPLATTGPLGARLQQAGSGGESGPLRMGTAPKLFEGVGKEDATPSQPAGPPSVIAGRYRVLNMTEGPEGPTYIVCDVERHQFYVLRSQKSEISELKKHNVNFIKHDGIPFTVVQIGTNGLTLRNFISTVGALPPDLVAQHGVTMLKAIAAEHAKGPILTARKYITPDTIALNAMGEIALEPPAEQIATPRSDGMTTPFLPTEQAQHGRLAPTSDIFAIGAILFFMLTGTPPPPAGYIPKKQGGVFETRPFEEYPGIPEDFAQVLATALQPNPADRYPTAADMANALRSTMAGHNVKKEFPKVPLAIVGALVAVAVVAWAFLAGPLHNLNLSGLAHLVNQGNATPVATEVAVVAPTPIPAPPLARAILNSVDSRRFPANTLYFSALDPTGMPILGLPAATVKLRENGADITSMRLSELRRTTDAINVLVALDTSDKMAGHAMDDAKTALHILADRLQPGDNMSLLTFGDAARQVQEYTVSKSQFLAAVDAQQAAGKTQMVDIVNVATQLALEQLQGGYTALVIVTNGGLPKGKSAATNGAVDAIVRVANTANLPIYFVGMDKATYPQEAAEQMAARTGGVALVADVPDTGGVGEAIKKVEQQLHNVYKLNYDSPSPSPQADHNVELAVTVNGVTQTDKRSYKYWER